MQPTLSVFYNTARTCSSNKESRKCFKAGEMDRCKERRHSLRLLNFSPIHFDDQEIKVGRLPYGDDGAQLRRVLVLSEDPDSILTFPPAKDSRPAGEQETIRLTDHRGLTAEFIGVALPNRLPHSGGNSRDYKPIEVGSRARKDLLRTSFPSQQTLRISGIAIHCKGADSHDQAPGPKPGSIHRQIRRQ